MSTTKSYIAWESIHRDVSHLQELIVNEDQIPDVIVTIGRGGLIPGTLLAYKLNVKTVVNYTLQSYSDKSNTSTGSFTEIQKLDDSFINEYKDSRILIVDDLSDKGNTLIYIKEQLTEIKDLQFATLYIKQGTKLIPDYFVADYSDDIWLVFPWEADAINL
jgi:xanthine phosphoribosyltransferase